MQQETWKLVWHGAEESGGPRATGMVFFQPWLFHGQLPALSLDEQCYRGAGERLAKVTA